MKSYRQTAIAEIVEQESVTSQEQLKALLFTRGIKATQATISRDISELGLVKHAVDGVYRRQGAQPEPAAAGTDELAQAVSDYLRKHEAVSHMLVLRTPPGEAQSLAVVIDRSRVKEIVGTIAGDDTILIICRTPADAAAFDSRLGEWLKGET
jgi:transcriptional regulator of arginine metabolism